MPGSTSDLLYERAAKLARDVPAPEAVADLLLLAAGDRAALERARNRYAGRLHGQPDDWEATAALRLLNRALAELKWTDPLDWKQRWARHRKP